MGKASKWFRGLLGLIKPASSDNSPSPIKPPKDKRRWSFVKSYREKDYPNPQLHLNSSGHVAAATTAGGIVRQQWAAIKIQAAFRGCLILSGCRRELLERIWPLRSLMEKKWREKKERGMIKTIQNMLDRCFCWRGS